MKILLAHKNCLFGGVETLMVALAPLLQAYGHECELFFFHHGPMEDHLPENCVAHFGDLADCIKLVESERFDVVHINSIDWTLGLSAVRSVGAKLVVMAQGMVVPGWTSTNCDAFVACAKWHIKEQEKYTDLPIHVIFNGIDTNLFKPDDHAAPTSPPIVAWVGRGVDGAKQINKMAAVAPLLQRSGARIWVAEPHGPEEVEKAVPGIKSALLPFAEFWGAVPREKMPHFFQEVAASGGCVISTSKSEGLPMALVEAQACGCPVIGSDVRGVNECVDPVHGGVLYPFELEPEKLASLVIDTLHDKDRMRWRRAACIQYVREQFALERMAQEYISVYQEALGAQRNYFTGLRTRLQLAPLLHWKDYVAHRWGPGHYQYEASQKLAERGEWRLASLAARVALATCHTIYVRPWRLVHLLQTHMHLQSELRSIS